MHQMRIALRERHAIQLLLGALGEWGIVEQNIGAGKLRVQHSTARLMTRIANQTVLAGAEVSKGGACAIRGLDERRLAPQRRAALVLEHHGSCAERREKTPSICSSRATRALDYAHTGKRQVGLRLRLRHASLKSRRGPVAGDFIKRLRAQREASFSNTITSHDSNPHQRTGGKSRSSPPASRLALIPTSREGSTTVARPGVVTSPRWFSAAISMSTNA